MSVPGWFALGAALAAYLCAWRYYAGRIAWHEKSAHRDIPNGGDITWGIFCGAFVAMAAPVIFPYELLLRGRGFTMREFTVRRMLYTPSERRDG